MYVEPACHAYVGRLYGTDGEHERLMAGLKRWGASADWQRRLADAPDGRLIPSMEEFISGGLYLDHPPAADETAKDYRADPDAKG